jgi:hypothetical protein
LRFLVVSIAALTLAAAASAQQVPAATKKTPAASTAKAKPIHHAATPAKTGSAKTSVSKSAASKSLTSNSGAATSAASRIASSKTGSKAAAKSGLKSRRTVVARRPPTQQQPTVDRYKEIQHALVEKGYFQGPVDGAWNAGSVDALKRFQKDQNLDPDGKIGSLSLIALGLGPKRNVASAQPSPASNESVDPPPVAQPQQ